MYIIWLQLYAKEGKGAPLQPADLEREGSGHCCADNQHADVALEGDVQRPNTGGLGEQEPVKGGRRPQQRRALKWSPATIW